MYFPYLRGKQFELQSLIDIDSKVFKNTIPILEPVHKAEGRIYGKLYPEIAKKNNPVILVVNPYQPQSHRLSVADVQHIITKDFAGLTNLYLGFLIDTRFSIAELTAFLKSNPTKKKAIIFRYNPLQPDLNS